MDGKDVIFDHNLQRAECLELEDKLEKIVLTQEAQVQDSVSATRSSPSPAAISVISEIAGTSGWGGSSSWWWPDMK